MTFARSYPLWALLAVRLSVFDHVKASGVLHWVTKTDTLPTARVIRIMFHSVSLSPSPLRPLWSSFSGTSFNRGGISLLYCYVVYSLLSLISYSSLNPRSRGLEAIFSALDSGAFLGSHLDRRILLAQL